MNNYQLGALKRKLKIKKGEELQAGDLLARKNQLQAEHLRQNLLEGGQNI